MGHYSNSDLSFSLNVTSDGDILGGSNEEWLGGSNGGGKITFGKLMEIRC